MKKHVERNIFADRMCIVICVLLALAVFFLSFVGECRLAEIYECLAVANRMANDYDRQAHQLVATYNLTNNLRGTALSTRHAGVCLLFRAADDTLVQNALPLVKQAGFTGAFLLTAESLPGDEGCIGVEDYAALLSAGWQTVLGGGRLSELDAAQELDQYISRTAALMEQRGIALPQIYYSDFAGISDACLEVLGAHGMRVVIQGGHDTEQTNRYLGQWWGDMYICGSVTIQDATSHVQLSVYDAGLVGGSMVITTRRVTDEDDSDPDLDCSTVKLGQCLEWLRDAYSIYGFHVIGFERLYSEKYSSYEQLRSLLGEYETPEQYMSELSRRILELSDLSTGIIEQQYRPLTNGYTLTDFFDFVSNHELSQIFELISLRRETTRLYRRESDTTAAQDYVTDT